MATWHQSRNGAAMAALYARDETQWKCVSDKPGQFASAISFASARDAQVYCDKTGALLIPPKSEGN